MATTKSIIMMSVIALLAGCASKSDLQSALATAERANQTASKALADAAAAREAAIVAQAAADQANSRLGAI